MTFHSTKVMKYNSFQLSTFATCTNYTAEKKFVMGFIGASMCIGIIFAFLFFYNYTWFFKKQSTFTIVLNIVSCNTAFGVSTWVLHQYQLLLICLRTRFRKINSLMRCYTRILPLWKKVTSSRLVKNVRNKTWSWLEVTFFTRVSITIMCNFKDRFCL